MALTKGDDFPIHQTSEPIGGAFVGSSPARFIGVTREQPEAVGEITKDWHGFPEQARFRSDRTEYSPAGTSRG